MFSIKHKSRGNHFTNVFSNILYNNLFVGDKQSPSVQNSSGFSLEKNPIPDQETIVEIAINTIDLNNMNIPSAVINNNIVNNVIISDVGNSLGDNEQPALSVPIVEDNNTDTVSISVQMNNRIGSFSVETTEEIHTMNDNLSTSEVVPNSNINEIYQSNTMHNEKISKKKQKITLNSVNINSAININ